MHDGISIKIIPPLFPQFSYSNFKKIKIEKYHVSKPNFPPIVHLTVWSNPIVQSFQPRLSTDSTLDRLDSPPLVCLSICHLSLIYSRFEKTQKFVINSTPRHRSTLYINTRTHTHTHIYRERPQWRRRFHCASTPPSRPLMSPLARRPDGGSVKISWLPIRSQCSSAIAIASPPSVTQI